MKDNFSMSTLMSSHVGDIEQGITRRSATVSTTCVEDSDYESARCSDEECGSDESCTRLEIVRVDDTVEMLSEKTRLPVEKGADLGRDGGVTAAEDEVGSKIIVHLSKDEKVCRICHLSLDGSDPDSGHPIELGCSCKYDLGAAHIHCAEAWFKIKGDKTCEICGSTARNVGCENEVEQVENEVNDAIVNTAQLRQAEIQRLRQCHRFLNSLLACMVFVFVISWLFHFNVPT